MMILFFHLTKYAISELSNNGLVILDELFLLLGIEVKRANGKINNPFTYPQPLNPKLISCWNIHNI